MGVGSLANRALPVPLGRNGERLTTKGDRTQRRMGRNRSGEGNRGRWKLTVQKGGKKERANGKDVSDCDRKKSRNGNGHHLR